ncbi:UNVERIFIED_CONTAM: Cation/H(+) antiporter 14 [Sesamum angustifolium]|uniref:Cation/H(+) antiporter 14 n=1 Tax=Sesamum angustifolium TaxID=2727405 RepID=A0AAW2QSM9_9LAMI
MFPQCYNLNLKAIFFILISDFGDQAGVILGSSFLGSNEAFSKMVFPISSFYVVDTFAYFGVMLFLFIIGVKTDMSLVRKTGKKAVAIGICSFSIPLILNIMLSQFLMVSTPMEPILHRSIVWIASFQALSSFHVIVCLLADLNIRNSELGRLAISSSLISGLCSCIWTFILFIGKLGVTTKNQQHYSLLAFSATSIMVLFSLFIFRPLILWMTRRTSNAKSLKESYVCAIFIILLGSAIFGELFGIHFLFGPMILGLVIPDGPPLGSALVNKLECFVSSIILPIYFVVSGAKLDFSAISLRNFAIIVLLAFFALLWKIVAVMLPSIYCKMTLIDALYLGLIMGNQGIMEVLLLGKAQALQLIDKQSYSIMVLSIVMFTGILAPIVKFSYKPLERYTGRSAPVLMGHHPSMRDPFTSQESEPIINALKLFEREKKGHATVYPFTAISSYAEMHDSVCSLAAEKKVSLVIVLFHRHPHIHVTKGESTAIRVVNHNIIKKSPCSVGILVDCGAMNYSVPILSRVCVYRIGVFFLGGPDDREALAYARRMAQHPNVRLTLVHIMDADIDTAYSSDMEQDLHIVNEYRDIDMMNERCLYREELVKDSLGVASVIRRMTSYFDLILVGRQHDNDSPLLAGISDWNEFPELGCLGDMIVSSDSTRKVSVLVVQQALSSESKMGNPEFIRESSYVLPNMQYNDGGIKVVTDMPNKV